MITCEKCGSSDLAALNIYSVDMSQQTSGGWIESPKMWDGDDFTIACNACEHEMDGYLKDGRIVKREWGPEVIDDATGLTVQHEIREGE
jgi:hypothetical protein